MKYVSMLILALLVSAPISAQRIPQYKKPVQDAKKVEQTAKCEKDCKCVCHKSKKRSHGTRKDRSHDHKRGDRKRGQRGRSSRSRSDNGTSRRSRTRSHDRRGPPTKKEKDTKEVNDTQKRFEEMLKRLKRTNLEDRKIDWRKFAKMRK